VSIRHDYGYQSQYQWLLTEHINIKIKEIKNTLLYVSLFLAIDYTGNITFESNSIFNLSKIL